MNGQLFLLLFSMLLQNLNIETLPGPNRPGAGIGSSVILPGNAIPTPPAPLPPVRGRRQIGYAVDPLDGKFCLIVQIPPEDIVEFARGQAGQELDALVPDEIRNFRIERVIFRIGTDRVEKILPNPNTLSDSRTQTNSLQIVDLNIRTAVPIDQMRPAGSLATVAQNGPGFGGNATMSNSGNAPSFNNDGGTFPPVVPNPGNQTNGARVDVPFGQNTPQTRDGFSGPKSSFNNLLVPSQTNPAIPPYATATPPYAPANPYSAGSSTNPTTLGTNSNRQYSIAANPNNPSNYFDSPLGQQNSQSVVPQGGFAPPPSQVQMQQYGQPPMQQPHYASVNPYPTSQPGEYLQRPVPVTKISQAASTGDTDEPPLAKDNLLPFLLLFSIVVNVYLGSWMVHLRKHYRRLVSNMRGIPVSDLA